MTGGEEVELKLQIRLIDVATLLADPIFAGHDPVSRDQVSVYFDTAKHALHAAGLSLRIRASGGKRVQTIKTESRAAASLYARGEWERPVRSGIPDLDDAPPTLADIMARTEERLAPLFEVVVNRTSVIHTDGGDRIELVADQGRIVAEGRESPVIEIELELLDGDRQALFALARRLAGRVPVRLGVQSKSERGYALLAGKQRLSVKAEPIVLAPDIDTATLFETVAGACIRQFRLNEDRLLAGGSPASLHQARVGLRRMRSLLSIFADMIAGDELDRFQSGFRALAAALGTVRDVDVMIEKIDHEPTLERLRAARIERYADVMRMLDSAETRALLLDFVAWLSVGAWREREETWEIRETPALVAAPAMLDGLRRRIKRRGKHLAHLDAHNRHRVRIVGKKLRYTAEFFAGLYPSKKAVRRRAAFLDAIEDLQTALGHLNDIASGRALLAELGIADADAVLAAGKKTHTRRLLADAERAYEALIDSKRFWR